MYTTIQRGETSSSSKHVLQEKELVQGVASKNYCSTSCGIFANLIVTIVIASYLDAGLDREILEFNLFKEGEVESDDFATQHFLQRSPGFGRGVLLVDDAPLTVLVSDPSLCFATRWFGSKLLGLLGTLSLAWYGGGFLGSRCNRSAGAVLGLWLADRGKHGCWSALRL